MKQFYRITRNTESKPSRLIASVVLAFIVMLFVNGFIGGMGGFPTFIAFAVLFFLLRTRIGDGNQQKGNIVSFDHICGRIFSVLGDPSFGLSDLTCDRMGQYKR